MYSGVLSRFSGVPHGGDRILSFVRSDIVIARKFSSGIRLTCDKNEVSFVSFVHVGQFKTDKTFVRTSADARHESVCWDIELPRNGSRRAGTQRFADIY